MSHTDQGARAKKRSQKRVKPKGIYCLEGDWWGKMGRRASVEPALEVLHQWEPYYIPYIHRDVATRAEFDHYIKKWCQTGYSKRYPILYLAFHGGPGEFYVGDGRKKGSIVYLDDLEAQLAGRCEKRIIHFGSCSTMDQNGHRINRFVRNTKALAVCGFREDVLWLDSAALELLIFGAMQMNALTIPGANAMKRRIKVQAKSLAKSLGFRMVVKKVRKTGCPEGL